MALLYYALGVLCLHVTYLECNEFQKNGIGPNSIIQLEDRSLSLKHHSVHKRAVCDCGPNSDKCEWKEEKKVCTCQYKYRQKGEYCEPFCEKNWQCDHGGSCVKESCQCLKGTSGSFCEIVDECHGEKGIYKCGDPEEVICEFDEKTLKTYCSCRTYEYIYDESTRRCTECDCDKEFGSCSLVDGIKTCKCNPGTALKKEYSYSTKFTCQPCDCGTESNNCSYEGYYSKQCDCKDGYHQAGDMCVTCECGPHGKCIRDSWGCTCDNGYASFRTNDRKKIYCKECNCGKYGVCSFEKEEKKCKCDKKYAEREGRCLACQCYADDKVVGCFFEGKIQHCLCPEGYENGTFVCKDINECLDPNACPSDAVCLNTMGSYECSCKEGYEPYYDEGNPKINGCIDIDECENEDMCPRVNTVCTNFPGTYSCECEKGFEPVAPYESAIVAGCQPIKMKEPDSPWKTGIIILGVIFGLCIAGLGIAIIIRRRSKRQQPRMDTVHYNNR